MTDLASSSRRGTGALPVLRQVAGVLVIVLAVLAGALFAVGAVNPWQFVELDRYFGNPTFGLVVVAVLVLLASWLLAPIRNEAAQIRRGRVRVAAVIAVVVGLLAWGLVGRFFSQETTVLARNSTGDRALALVDYGGDNREMHVLAGRGLAARDVGSLGIACGEVRGSFLGHDEVEVVTSYGTWQFRLDPATGQPLEGIGQHCAGGR